MGNMLYSSKSRKGRRKTSMHTLYHALKDIIWVVTNNPQGGDITGFPFMFHSPFGEHPVPAWVFLVCVVVCGGIVGVLWRREHLNP
jgi:hypothetical protein